MARLHSAIALLAIVTLLQGCESAPQRTKRSSILSVLGLEPPPFNETYVGRIFDSVADRMQEVTVQVMGMAVQSAIGSLFSSGGSGGGLGGFGGEPVGVEMFSPMDTSETKGRDINVRQPMVQDVEKTHISKNLDKCIKATESLGIEAIEEAAQGIENCIDEAATNTASYVEDCVKAGKADREKCLQTASSLDNRVVTSTASCIERHVHEARNMVNRAARDTLRCLQERARRR